MLEDCANDGFYNISDSLTLNGKGQFEGQGKIIYDRKAMCRRLHQIHSIEGNFLKGHPVGPATITYRDGSHSKAKFDKLRLVVCYSAATSLLLRRFNRFIKQV